MQNTNTGLFCEQCIGETDTVRIVSGIDFKLQVE